MSKFLAAVAIVVCLAGSVVPQVPKEPRKNTAMQASNDFACDLYRAIDVTSKGKNLFFSPYSISSALAMTMEGARGQTALEMGKVLRLPTSLQQGDDMLPWLTAPWHQGFADLNRRFQRKADAVKDQAIRQKVAVYRKQLDDLNARIRKAEKEGIFQGFAELNQQAQKLAATINELQKQVDQYELRIANALFGEKTYPFAPAFTETIDKYYGTGLVRPANFREDFPGERDKINAWVLEQTNDRIKDLIPELPPEVGKRVRLILANAIFFKGQWSLPFEEKLTKKEDFLLAQGGKIKTAMMHLYHKKARYAAFDADGTFFQTPPTIPRDDKNVQTYPDNGFLMVELPVKGDKLSMVVIAPQKVDGLPSVEARLTGANLAGWLSRLEKRPVQVAMPKFKMETDYSLGDLLQKLGMNAAFSEKDADFTGMTTSRSPDDRLSISKVLHKAFVEVNEKGAEAAAATAVIMVAPTSAIVSTPFTPNFRADRPFVFLIRDMETGTVLFLGRVSQPTGA